MKQVKGFWLPDRETRVDELLKDSEPGVARYQRRKLLAALAFCQDFDTAVDIGAHVGLWSLQLASQFHHLVAFEPDPEKHACYAANLVAHHNVTLLKYGLSDHSGFAGLTHKAGTSLKTHVDLKGSNITLRRLDEFDLAPGFIKIDVEGYELAVLQGAIETIRRTYPTIIVEQKPGVASKRYGFEDRAALAFLVELGYEMRAEFNGDFILTHPAG